MKRVTYSGFKGIDFFQFQSTPSVKRVTLLNLTKNVYVIFQSTPSVKRVTIVRCCYMFSIMISIHTLCEEGDKSGLLKQYHHNLFQSTPSVKRVTSSIMTAETKVSNFNPHPLWRGWPDWFSMLVIRSAWFQSTPSVKRVTILVLHVSDSISLISIHTLCEEGDNKALELICTVFEFQSTPSVKRVTWCVKYCLEDSTISIHTLCEEGDWLVLRQRAYGGHFNPHPLWRGWRYWWFKVTR